MVLYLRWLVLICGGVIDFFGVSLFGGFLFICVGVTGALMSRYTSVVGPGFKVFCVQRFVFVSCWSYLV